MERYLIDHVGRWWRVILQIGPWVWLLPEARDDGELWVCREAEFIGEAWSPWP